MSEESQGNLQFRKEQIMNKITENARSTLNQVLLKGGMQK